MVSIRKSRLKDKDEIWKNIQEVISLGEINSFGPDTSKENILPYWCGKNKHTYVAIINEKIIGTFLIKSIQPELGSHIGNVSYMIDKSRLVSEIGQIVGEFSVKEAKRLGYEALQLNIVLKNNEKVINIWKKIGFKVIGKIPQAFNYKEIKLVDAYIMYKKL